MCRKSMMVIALSIVTLTFSSSLASAEIVALQCSPETINLQNSMPKKEDLYIRDMSCNEFKVQYPKTTGCSDFKLEGISKNTPFSMVLLESRYHVVDNMGTQYEPAWIL